MKLRTNLVFLIAFTSFFQTLSQSQKAVYAELLGSGVIASVNYDFRFKSSEKGYGMRIGTGVLPGALIIPIEANRILGKRRVKFEYGVGLSSAIFINKEEVSEDLTFNDNVDALGAIAYGKAGIRILPKKDTGLFFSFNWYPMLNRKEFIPLWLGLGMGYSWQKKSSISNNR